jgi:hypothetical protein
LVPDLDDKVISPPKLNNPRGLLTGRGYGFFNQAMLAKLKRRQSHLAMRIGGRRYDHCLYLREHSLEIIKGLYAMLIRMSFSAADIWIINTDKVSAWVCGAFIGVISPKDSRAYNGDSQTLIHGVINPTRPSKGKIKAIRSLRLFIPYLGNSLLIQQSTNPQNTPNLPKTPIKPRLLTLR